MHDGIAVDHRFAKSAEASGQPFSAPATDAKCGAGLAAIDEDGFCKACGFRREAPTRDHFEHVVSPRFAGITDRGLRHHRNEDFFVIDWWAMLTSLLCATGSPARARLRELRKRLPTRCSSARPGRTPERRDTKSAERGRLR